MKYNFSEKNWLKIISQNLPSHPKKINSSTTYFSSQPIGSQTQKISDEKKCCLTKINGSNKITIKPLTQKDSVEISVESKNNSDIKNNAREERGIATNTTEDICDTQNNSDVNHIKNDAKKPDNQLYHNLSKDTRQRNNSQFNTCTKNWSNSGETQQQQKVLRFTSSQKICIHRRRQYDKKNRWLFTYQFY